MRAEAAFGAGDRSRGFLVPWPTLPLSVGLAQPNSIEPTAPTPYSLVMSAVDHSPLWLNICRRLELDPATPGTLDRAADALKPHIGRGTLQRIQQRIGEPRFESIKKIAKAIGCTPTDLIDTAPHQPLTAAEPAARYIKPLQPAGLAHGMSYLADTVPYLTREELMQTKDLPEAFWVELPDDALAPKLPKGTVVRFSTGIEPAWGNIVLLRDAKGASHVRVHTQDHEHEWRASATSEVYMPFTSATAGVTRLAVLTAVETRNPVVF